MLINRNLERHPFATRQSSQLHIGQGVYDLITETLVDDGGQTINLRPQSMQVLHQLASYQGEVVSKSHLVETVWPGLTVTEDSVTQCIADIRKAIGDHDKRILRTIPKKGYRLTVDQATTSSDVTDPVAQKKVTARSVALVLGFCVAALLIFTAWVGHQRTAPDDLRIAVLPFDNETGDPRLARLGRGMSIDIAEDLASTSELGVIGSESAFEAAQMPLSEAAEWLDANFLLSGEIEASQESLSLTARLTDGRNQQLLWSQSWTTPITDYAIMRENITQRVSASLNAHFWFGALNLAVAEKAITKPRRSLSAYEEYLLGVSKIAWTDADYQAAMAHFRRAVEIDPSYARAWMMIGVMLQWIGDVSPEDIRLPMHRESHAALEKAFLHAPNDAIVQTTMSVVYNEKGEADAAQRAILRGVELAPNNPDVLAAAAWQALPSGLEGDAPLRWARRAVELNPKAPPWHRLGVGIAAFLAEDYQASIDAMEDAPPHHKKFAFLAASHIMKGDVDRANEVAAILKEKFPDYTLSGDFDLHRNPALDRFFEAAKQAGITF